MTPKDAAGSVPEYFVSCLDHIEMMGTNARYVLAAEQFADGKMIFLPKLHFIMPNSALPNYLRQVLLVPLGGTVGRLMPTYIH